MIRVGAAIAAVVLVLAGAGCGEAGRSPSVRVGTVPGDRAPALKGTLASGEPFTWRSGDGWSLLVVVTDPLCPPCEARLREMSTALERYRRREVTVVAAAPAGGAAPALRYPVVGLDSAMLERWRVPGRGGRFQATVLLVDPDGTVRYRHAAEHVADLPATETLLATIDEHRRPGAPSGAASTQTPAILSR